MEFAQWLVTGVEVYLGLGLVFAVPFAWRGVHALDPRARSGTIGFRILLLPGSSALWPLLLFRLVRARAARS